MFRPLILGIFLLTACVSTGPDRRGLFDAASPTPAGAPRFARVEENGCRAMSTTDRLRLLKIASPENFPRTRYRKGPRHGVEKETDCSHFVHEIYRRAGYKFSFRSTRELADAPEFERVQERNALPGDLMLFRGHVGIVDRDGRIISATKSRRGRSSITRFDRTAFRRYRGNYPVLRYRCNAPWRQLAEQPR